MGVTAKQLALHPMSKARSSILNSLTYFRCWWRWLLVPEIVWFFQDPVVIINGLTKIFRLPGFRICWVIGPKVVSCFHIALTFSRILCKRSRGLAATWMVAQLTSCKMPHFLSSNPTSSNLKWKRFSNTSSRNAISFSRGRHTLHLEKLVLLTSIDWMRWAFM